MFEAYLGLGPRPLDQFLSPSGNRERCGSVMNSSSRWHALTPPRRACPGGADKAGRVEFLFQVTGTRAAGGGPPESRDRQGLGEAGTLTLPGARLQLLHAVHGEPADAPAHGALLPLALLFTLLGPRARRREPVPAVALRPGLQASVDIGPAGKAGPGVSCPRPRPRVRVLTALGSGSRNDSWVWGQAGRCA